MNSKLWIKKATSMTLMVAIFATYSMVALAASGKAAGELIVNGSEQVSVNGESVASGRTIFTSSTISTPQSSAATLNLGKAGMIELAPNSIATVSFDSEMINVDLAAGSLSVIGAANGVTVAAAGKTSVLAAGESVSTAQDDNTVKSGSGNWWILAVVLGAAAGVMIYTVTRENDRALGSTAVVVSPNR